MEKINFNHGWFCKSINGTNKAEAVTLPHDAMLGERRSEESIGGGNIGWFEGLDYGYSKDFEVPKDYEGKVIVFEFEGVYHNAEVFINGTKAAFHPYGYTNFYVNAEGLLKFGALNMLKVNAYNSDQPNSRWYSGTGIYRPVSMFVADKEHILLNGVKIKTLGTDPAEIEINIKTSSAGKVKVEILDGERVIKVLNEVTDGAITLKSEIDKAELWCPENPKLYTCRVSFADDTVSEHFGIRTLGWNAKEGFTLNGKRIILRGACIHHDNGILGACTYPEAEERRVRLMLENGYNALRSAHNPCSKTLLDACDKLGMLMVDEYVDVWYIHKTKNDYVNYLQECWQQDLKDIVDKDYNHPCVIMYSTGNEVSETAQPRGIEFTGQMTQYLHSLDDTRPVTCGINIFFNFLSSIGFGVYSDKKAEKELQRAERDKEKLQHGQKKKKPVGSEFYNTMAGIFGDRFMKMGATLYPCDVKTRDAFANMDIAGYNYGILRYKHDIKKYPERLILGTETFCKDTYSFWEQAKRHPQIIGDFVWAGMDYLGEVAVGAWEHEEYAPQDASPSGWLTNGGGRVNLIGTPNGEAAYTKVAYEVDKIAVAVRPVHQKGRLSPSAWKMSNARLSWSWCGCTGEMAEVEIYARAAEVELLINGKAVARKRISKDCWTSIKVPYEDGELVAIGYDSEGREIARTKLVTAGEETILRLTAESPSIKKDGLCFVRLQYTDNDGILKPMERHRITAAVKGGELLGLGSASPYTTDNFKSNTVNTYYGEALAVVRSDGSGDVEIIAKDENGSTSLKIPYKS